MQCLEKCQYRLSFAEPHFKFDDFIPGYTGKMLKPNAVTSIFHRVKSKSANLICGLTTHVAVPRKTCAKFPSRVAVRLYENGDYKNYTYSELYGVCEYISQNLQQIKCNKGTIGLVSERNIAIPCVIAAVHKCCTTFMFIDPRQDIKTVAKDVNFTVIITVDNKNNKVPIAIFCKKPEKSIAVFDLVINFYNCSLPNNQDNRYLEQHSFIAMTSGSTGDPKHIQVPIICIQPNIDDLTKMFDITPQDIIFFSTPLTFDPSMIEIMLACINGASLLIAPDKADILFPVTNINSITVWQTTPSKFFQYSNGDIKDRILGANSTLKILALGGEPLNGVKRLKELKHCQNNTRIFTLYGVTEMSCWACAAELDLDRIASDKEVPLGNCLSETEVAVEPTKDNSNTGNIVLASKTRTCYILSKSRGYGEMNSLKFINTGDIGEIKNGNIYYRGRKDDIVKRFGHKVNLQQIESTIMQCPRVKTCSCVWLPKPMLLVVYFSSESLSSQELLDFLKCKMDDKHWPDKVVRVDNLPTNAHGKISKKIVASMYDKWTGVPPTIENLKLIFLKELQVAVSKNYTFEQIKDNNFNSIGGTSFLAVSMCNKLSLICPQFGKFILPYLMSVRYTIGEILEMAQKEICIEETQPKKRLKRIRSGKNSSHAKTSVECSSSSKSTSLGNAVDFIIVWTYDTGKCVDASPTLYQTGLNLFVTVGSHSGKIVVMDAISGLIQGVNNIKSRVEAAVLCCHGPGTVPCGIVGAHDGTVLCYALETCKDLWRTNINAMVKSKAVCCNGLVYVAAYDGNIWCIDVMTGAIKCTISVADQAISADLVLAKNAYILLGTLSGVCASVYTATNTLAWRSTLSSPVFANPVVYDRDKYVVFAEVNGEVHCRTVEKGIKIWKYQGAKGNIFSSLYMKQVDKLKWQMLFGCFDNNVYSINIKNFQPSLHWKAQMASPVYSTPCGLSDKLILTASNNGRLYIINANTGLILAEYQLPNETFSSPATYGDYIFIGCRDDNLYSLKYTLNDCMS